MIKPVITGVTWDRESYQVGDRATLTIDVTFDRGRPRTLFGMTAQPDYAKGERATSDMLAAFPGVRYTREFGKDTGDTDSLPELPQHGTGKMALGDDVLVHVSWKDDVEQLKPWLDALTRPVLLTWWHEPMGDVTPERYRMTVARVREIIDEHPKRDLVLGHGPIITRAWLMSKNGDPDDWAYDGMTFYGVDCYNDHSTRYRPGDELFAPLDALRRRYPGIDLVVPEYGVERLATDPTGEQRAQVMREHHRYLLQRQEQHGDILAVAWWNIGNDVITGVEPEQTVWREILASR